MADPVLRRSNREFIVSQLVKELQPERLFPNLTAGLIIGVVGIIISISFASLVFTGEISAFTSNGIVLVIFGAMLMGIVVSLFSSSPGAIAISQDAPAAILALIAGSISNSMPAGATPQEMYLTVVAAIAIASVLTGLSFLVLGYYRLGELIRFLPYPVIGGFLAGTGWLLVTGSIAVMTGISPGLANLSTLLQGDIWLRWTPGLFFAILLLVILNRYSHFMIMPAMMIGSIALFYIVVGLTNTSIAELSIQGWLLEAPRGGLSGTLFSFDPGQVNWLVILGQIGNLATLLVISAVALLLNASGLELIVGEDINLNRELKAAGFANIAAGLGGGLVGYHMLSGSTLSHRIGKGSRLVGVIAAAFFAVVLFGGMPLITIIPKIILGSMLMMLGLSFLVEWVYEGWYKFSRVDYLIVITILVVIAAVGFLQGVILGIALAVIMFVVNYSRVNVVKHALSGAIYQSRVTRCRSHRQILQQQGDQIYILNLQGFIFFGTANNLLNQVRARADAADLTSLRYAVLDFKEVTGLDSTAILSFEKLIQFVNSRQITMVFTNPLIESALPSQSNSLSRFFSQLENETQKDPGETIHIFPDLDRGLEWCENKILLNAGENLQDDQESLAKQLQSILPDATNIEPLMSYFERMQIDSGSYLMKQDDPPEDLYFIESGQVTAQLEFPDRTPVRLETMRGGRVVGEIGFYLNRPRTAAVVADEPSTVHRLSMLALKQMERDDPQAAFAFHQGIIRLVSERLTHLITTVNALQR